MAGSLHTKYRPKKWADVVGQGAAVKAFARIIKARESHAYLLSGPSGTGKTTLARIGATELGAYAEDILEVDAATNTGIDAMRAIQQGLNYRPFGEGAIKAVILDECHALSKAAWQALLKAIEEPPPYVFWFLCTTDPGKVPPTVKTRCTPIALKPVQDKDLGEIYDRVCEAEKIDLPGDVGDMIIRESRGSPRQMLVNLSMCREAKTKREAADILRTALESDPVLELCRLITSGGSWAKAMGIVEKMGDNINPESVRIVVSNYFGSVARGSTSNEKALAALGVLEAFGQSYNPSDGVAPLMLSIGRVLLGE